MQQKTNHVIVGGDRCAVFSRSRLNGYEFRIAIEGACHKICSALSLKPVTLAWNDAITTARISRNGDIELANVADDAIIDRKVFDRYVGFVLHELLHRKYTNFDPRGDNQYVDQLHNAIEDAWIENNCIAEGLVGNAQGLLRSVIDGMSTDALDAWNNDWHHPARYPFLLAVYARKHSTVKLPLADGLQPIFDEACARLTKAQSSYDTLAIAEWVYAQLQNVDKQKPQPQPQPKPQDGGQGQGDGSQTDQNGSTSPDQGEGEGEGATPRPNPTGTARSPVKSNGQPVTAREVEPTNKAPEGTGTGGCYSKSQGMSKRGHVYGQQQFNIDLNVGAKLRYEVRKLFENTGTSEYQPKRKAGALNVKALHTVPSGNDRLFKRRLDTEGIDSAVVIVLDVSSSMFHVDIPNSPIQCAINACASLLDALGKAGVDTALLTFGDAVGVVQGFGGNAKKSINALQGTVSGGCTNDYFAVRYAHELLHGNSAQRKVCFVLTDGQGDRHATKDQIESGARLGITTIGIGILCDVSSVYSENVTVRDVKSIGTVAFNKIKLVA
ncbi:VWA domain-containing protein [bacterium]|nr:VWA domain-containing protein [bacterium]NBX48891.1 VWA domain-containing protein [bacterium]